MVCIGHICVRQSWSFTQYDRQNDGPQSVQVRIPETCEYVSLRGKWDFAHVIKLRICNEEVIPVGPHKHSSP